jgi:hypothetical protein
MGQRPQGLAQKNGACVKRKEERIAKDVEKRTHRPRLCDRIRTSGALQKRASEGKKEWAHCLSSRRISRTRTLFYVRDTPRRYWDEREKGDKEKGKGHPEG